jgi:hypothetical protein
VELARERAGGAGLGLSETRTARAIAEAVVLHVKPAQALRAPQVASSSSGSIPQIVRSSGGMNEGTADRRERNEGPR